MLIVFDTETNGLPRDYHAPLEAVDNWPRVVELAWAVAENGDAVVRSHLIRPDGWELRGDAAAVNGISQEQLLAEGVPITLALQDLFDDLRDAELLVAHNVDFDRPVIGCELVRLGWSQSLIVLLSKPTYCTMQRGAAITKLPGRAGSYKWPRLQELYRCLFRRPPANQHRAAGDVQATLEIYREMRGRGY